MYRKLIHSQLTNTQTNQVAAHIYMAIYKGTYYNTIYISMGVQWIHAKRPAIRPATRNITTAGPVATSSQAHALRPQLEDLLLFKKDFVIYFKE